MHSPAVFAFCCLVVVTGCGRKTEPVVPATVETPAVPGISPTATASATAAAESGADTTASTLLQLTQAVRRFGVEQQRAPTTLDDLVKAGYLSSLPPAPPGKAFVIGKNLEVTLAGR
ncbi:MAG TPA: hypothetical protein VMF06_07055 [Candidatus Limnocylindria bacterium]|jgi:hypothetical protein|nr:hypothetical protein [Candidatus Limnocylindria bacterium]